MSRRIGRFADAKWRGCSDCHTGYCRATRCSTGAAAFIVCWTEYSTGVATIIVCWTRYSTGVRTAQQLGVTR